MAARGERRRAWSPACARNIRGRRRGNPQRCSSSSASWGTRIVRSRCPSSFALSHFAQGRRLLLEVTTRDSCYRRGYITRSVCVCSQSNGVSPWVARARAICTSPLSPLFRLRLLTRHEISRKTIFAAVVEKEKTPRGASGDAPPFRSFRFISRFSSK